MTNVTVSEPSDKGAVEKMQADIISAVKNFGAEKSDIESLVTNIGERAGSRQQIPGLIKQAYKRLLDLRKEVAQIVELTGSDGVFSAMAIQVNASLQAGVGLNLGETNSTLEKMVSHSNTSGTLTPETIAALHGARALATAVLYEYTDAASLYAQAADTPDLAIEKQWGYQLDRALVLEDQGREFGDNAALEESVALLGKTVLDLAPVDERPDDWATTKQALGNALGILGQRQIGTKKLGNAIAAFEAALWKRDRKKNPLLWSESQNSLGNALGALAHRQNDLEMLGQSAEAFERALELCTQENAPHLWAMAQNNLAAILQSVGQRNKDPKLLKSAVEAYKEVLKEWTRDKVPVDWATTMNNLGTALRLLGEHRKGPKTIEQSVAAYNSALAERSQEKLPQEWAMTQNNLGAALHKLAERDDDPETFSKAITAYEHALEVWSREEVPLMWGMTVANLGVARRSFAERTESLDSASQAVVELETVSDVFRELSHAHYSELCIEEVSKARKVMNALGGEQPKDLVNPKDTIANA